MLRRTIDLSRISNDIKYLKRNELVRDAHQNRYIVTAYREGDTTVSLLSPNGIVERFVSDIYNAEQETQMAIWRIREVSERQYAKEHEGTERFLNHPPFHKRKLFTYNEHSVCHIESAEYRLVKHQYDYDCATVTYNCGTTGYGLTYDTNGHSYNTSGAGLYMINNAYNLRNEYVDVIVDRAHYVVDIFTGEVFMLDDTTFSYLMEIKPQENVKCTKIKRVSSGKK